ncbi:MAG: DinB family protein [Armatimonadetes bacterium]|nr:DinB family protein [Armatimonadota bacterium]
MVFRAVDYSIVMTAHELLKHQAEIAYQELRDSLEGLTQEQSWAVTNLLPDEYLHSEGSILSQIAHIANGKFIYASVGFRNSEIRWRELSPKIDSLWPNLEAVTAWLDEAHQYWLNAWAEVSDLEEERPRFDGTMFPGWKLITIGIHHDEYHAGQIQLQRSILEPSDIPPQPEGDLWEKYCKDFPCW